MIRLEMRHLQMLLALHSTSNVTDAAAQLNITPSALSHRMREAERRLGAALFYRQSSRVEVTPAAIRLISSAQRVLREMEIVEREVVLMHGGYESVFRIGSRAGFCNAWISRFWKDAQEITQRIAVEIVPEAALTPLEYLRLGKIDLAILTGIGDSVGGLDSLHLFQDQLVGVVAHQHPSARHKFLTSAEFMESPFISYGVDIEPDHEYELFFSKHDGLPKKILNVGTVDAILEFIRNETGMSILPRTSINEAVYGKHLSIRPLTEQGLTINWHYACRKSGFQNSRHDKITSALVDWCAEQFSNPYRTNSGTNGRTD